MRKTIAITFLALGFLVLILVAAFTVIQLTASETGWFEQEFSKLSLADRMGMTLGDLGASVRTLVNYMNGQTETIDVLVTVNVSLMVFNLLPIPPLDGSRLWTTLIPGRWAYTLERYSRYITMGLFALLFVGALDIPLAYMRGGVTWLIDLLTDLPIKLLDLFV